MRVPLAALVEVEYPTRGPGYLDLARADDALRGAIKLYLTDNITVFENDAPLRPRASPIFACRFRPTNPSAAMKVRLRTCRARPCPAAWTSTGTSSSSTCCSNIRSSPTARNSPSSLRVDRFARTVTTTLRFLTPDGATRAFEFHGDPGLIALDPRWHQAALRFVVSGFWHILEGIDHLLFLLCLVLPFRRLRPLVIIVTAFTVGHSISLIAAALGFVPDALWFPPLVETLIAITIVYMALENIVQAAKGTPRRKRRRVSLDRRFRVRGRARIRIFVRVARIPAVLRRPSRLVAVRLQSRRRAWPDRRAARAGPGAWSCCSGTLSPNASASSSYQRWWCTPPGIGCSNAARQLAKFPFPRLDAAFIASAMRGLMAALILAALVWAANSWLRRWIAADALRKTPGS